MNFNFCNHCKSWILFIWLFLLIPFISNGQTTAVRHKTSTGAILFGNTVSGITWNQGTATLTLAGTVTLDASLAVSKLGNLGDTTFATGANLGGFPSLYGSDGTKRLNQSLFVYSAGTAYTLTTTSAALDLGTTDPVLVIDSPGTYLIRARVVVKYVGATYAGAQTVTFKVRRTNNTAADVTNSSTTIELPVLTTFTGGDVIALREVSYTTVNSDDSLTIFGILSADPAAGSVTATEADVVASRQYQ